MATEASANPVNTLPSYVGAPRTAAAPAAATPAGANQALGETDFLTLLTTQLQNQNPLNPVDDTQSVAELAQFSALQATNSMATALKTFQTNFATGQSSSLLLQAGSLLGQTVTVSSTDSTGVASTTTGTVKSIAVVNGAPQFTLVDPNGIPIVDASNTPVQFTTAQIVGITK